MPELKLRLLIFISLLTPFLSKAQPVTLPEKTSQIEKYNKLISRYRYDNPDSALFFVNKGLEEARKNNDKAGRALMLNQLGMINDNRGQFVDSRANYLEALGLYKVVKDKKGMATENIRLGVVEMRKGGYDKATSYFLEALKLSESIKDPKGIMEANITLGEAYTGQRSYETALNYLNISEKINDTIPLSNLTLNLYNDFGILYRETGKLEEAKYYFQKGIDRSNIPQYQGLNITLINNLASVYAKEGNTAYSIKLQKTALAKAEKIHNYIRQLQTLTGLAKSYENISVDSSLNYLYRAKELAEGRKAYKQVIDALQSIAQLYRKKGNFEAALDAKEEEYDLADKFFYKEMSQQVSNLQAQYELTKTQAKIQQLNLINSKQSAEHNVILAVAICSIIVLLIIAYANYRTGALNKQLLKANKQLDESNHVKDKLFSILGHDLRSPFISVINLLDLLDDDDIPEDSRKEMLQELGLTSKAGLETLTGLLKWGETQIKGLRINQQEFAVRPLADRVTQLLSTNASHKSITIKNSIQPELNLIADSDHVEFVLRNLLSNAIKFTRAGGKISFRSQFDPATNKATITVRDNGIGISPDRFEAIFSLKNVSNNGTFNEKGTSLGLVMCKEFIEANNGSISVRSAPGSGSDFSFILNATMKPVNEPQPRREKQV
ncbi:tetratricopeptide repeat-containing sensor histidine kinase [Mucilaginibacter sp. RS28]|uniref:histidine kinase n=1 Tax=Mucilaginibacter straminoryzae TaxID=2932774 RepID=A0A9X2BAR0_9SPHI|nr:tetratricopeptide repeat-containing sensor histidine kinase [Mucilaginibacter straminoryzae]MCJ8209057.1 tetratricopeptide repeat-containing sensor histidine kinase [Mucilaginibacter straminoryzae]